ncbi:MAG: DUF748 domain-containing protein [Candidatus Binatus sp.]|uniref:DUF748 domain-containing protein n=1 Tax=Candidatus Binatus sp. TaxID=2811406 RepID=UPI003C708C59
MANFLNSAVGYLEAALRHVRSAFHPSRPWIARARELGRSRRVRKIGVIVVAVLLFLGLAAYLAVPPVLRHVLTGPVAGSIHRQVSVGKIRFNLYALKLDVDQLHVGERDSPQPFVDIGHLRVKVSWTSIFRFAPVVGEVVVERPAIHVVRESQQRFNFSDLLESAPTPEKSKPAAPSAPMRFAVSNIQLRDGEVTFDDRLLGKQHKVEQIQINVPFIANLPSDVDVFVEPLLQMVIDGSPIRIAGVAKPFEATHDSVVDLKLHRLNLPLYVSYAPMKLPVKIPDGTLSADVYVHFVQAQSQPLIRLNGTVALDQLDVRDTADAPIAALKHAEVKLTDVEPLGAVFYLRSIWIDGLLAHVRLNPDGTNNLTSIASGNAAPASPPAQAAPAGDMTQAAVPVAGKSTAKSPMDFELDSFDLTNSAVEVQDNSGATPAAVAVDALGVGLKNFRTVGKAPASLTVNGKIRSGGTIAVKGALDLADSQVTTEVSIDQVDLPALQPFAQSVLAATIASGKLSAKANVQTHFATDHFNVHAEPATVAIENFEMDAPHEREKPVQWKSLSVAIGQFDLAARQATVSEVRSDGMHVFVRRERGGKLSLASLMRGAPAPPPRNKRTSMRETRRMAREIRRAARKPVQAAPPPSQSWQYQIASVAMEQTDATFEDDNAPQPVKAAVAPLNLHLKNVSSDFSKPFAVDVDGTLNRKGTFKVTGTAAIAPLKADLRVATKRLELAFADPYVSSRLNATITSANLTMDGAVSLEQARNDFLVSYRGDASLGSVRMLDKLTNDLFFRMNALNANKIDFALGKGPPKVHVGALTLSNFYSRVILNSTGKLNLKDITASPQEAPTSLTRATGAPGSKGAVPVAPASTPTPATAPSLAAVTAPGAVQVTSPSLAKPYAGRPMNADIELNKITLKGGKVDYTDNFIKPNYTANLSDMEGKVGAFGTKSTSPAAVLLDGKINGSAPINIDGSIDPLAPTAFVDIKAKANGIELTGLTPYSTKYTGYPIVKGTLTVDVHYLLDQGKLTADNHIFIDQLTFGDHVQSPDAMNLPIRFAVALLKNSKGEIDLRVPVSGSLSDPQFSIGSVIWSAFKNLLIKAVTSPFSLIAVAFGGSGAQQELGYIEFAPGYARLTPDSQKKLDTVATALADRTALKLNISGRVDPKLDKDGYREASLEHSIQVLRHKHEGDSADANAKSAALSAADYNKYLAQVYSAGKFQKPRDVIGFAKTIPPDQMKKLILANTAVSDQDLQHLAEARANAVRAYLSTKQVDAARMFIIAPKLDAGGIKDQGKTTRVDLSLE